MAALLILEPIFEDCSYGFRPGRSAHQALEEIRGHIQAGYQAVYDADLEGYFDSIPHEKLLACVRHRIADRSVVKLIRLWLEAPVVEEGEPGEGKDRAERSKKGTPQGGVISPLLANLYLHWFDKVFLKHRASPARGGSAKLVRYADDFVVMMRGRDVALEAFIEEKLEVWMGLKLNRQMRGWANYFSRGHPRGAYWELDWYVRWRLMRHLRRRGQRRFRPPKDEPWYTFFQRQGLVELNRSL